MTFVFVVPIIPVPVIPPDEVCLTLTPDYKMTIKDRGVTIEKLADGILSSKIAADHAKTSYTIGPDGTVDIASIKGNGAACIIFDGDGSSEFRMRVVVDGVIEDIVPANETCITIHAFTSSILVQAHNPGTVTVTAFSSSFGLRGVAR